MSHFFTYSATWLAITTVFYCQYMPAAFATGAARGDTAGNHSTVAQVVERTKSSLNALTDQHAFTSSSPAPAQMTMPAFVEHVGGIHPKLVAAKIRLSELETEINRPAKNNQDVARQGQSTPLAWTKPLLEQCASLCHAWRIRFLRKLGKNVLREGSGSSAEENTAHAPKQVLDDGWTQIRDIESLLGDQVRDRLDQLSASAQEWATHASYMEMEVENFGEEEFYQKAAGFRADSQDIRDEMGKLHYDVHQLIDGHNNHELLSYTAAGSNYYSILRETAGHLVKAETSLASVDRVAGININDKGEVAPVPTTDMIDDLTGALARNINTPWYQQRYIGFLADEYISQSVGPQIEHVAHSVGTRGINARKKVVADLSGLLENLEKIASRAAKSTGTEVPGPHDSEPFTELSQKIEEWETENETREQLLRRLYAVTCRDRWRKESVQKAILLETGIKNYPQQFSIKLARVKIEHDDDETGGNKFVIELSNKYKYNASDGGDSIVGRFIVTVDNGALSEVLFEHRALNSETQTVSIDAENVPSFQTLFAAALHKDIQTSGTDEHPDIIKMLDDYMATLLCSKTE